MKMRICYHDDYSSDIKYIEITPLKNTDVLMEILMTSEIVTDIKIFEEQLTFEWASKRNNGTWWHYKYVHLADRVEVIKLA